MQNFKQECFTVALIGEYELQERLKKLAGNIQEKYPSGGEKLNGKSVSPQQLFAAMSREIISQYVPQTVKRVPPGSWLETNINTANSSAYHAAEYNRLQSVKDLYQYYQYKTREDARVRPEHMRLDNRVYAANDPIWSEIWPPNGWNCRCYITPLTLEEVQQTGTYVPPVESQHHRDEFIKTIPPEFRRNSAITGHIFDKWINEKLSGMPEKKAEEIKKMSDEYSKSVGYNSSPDKNIGLPTTLKEFVGEENYPTEILSKCIRQPETLFRPDVESFTTEHGLIIFGVTKSQTSYIKQSLGYHEATHHLIFDNRIYYKGDITSKYLSNSYSAAQDIFYESQRDIKDLFELSNKNRTYKFFLDKYKDIDKGTLNFQIKTAADIVASLTDGKWGWGHEAGYWDSFKGLSGYMEFLAHSAEAKYLENIIANEYLPMLKKIQIDLINIILKK